MIAAEATEVADVPICWRKKSIAGAAPSRFITGDREVYRKQRHTAKRVFEGLRDGHAFTGGWDCPDLVSDGMAEPTAGTLLCASEAEGELKWIGRFALEIIKRTENAKGFEGFVASIRLLTRRLVIT